MVVVGSVVDVVDVILDGPTPDHLQVDLSDLASVRRAEVPDLEDALFEAIHRYSARHWWFRGRRRVYFGLLRAVLGGSRPARILDLGCGNGILAIALARAYHFAKVFAVDESYQAVAAIREANSN